MAPPRSDMLKRLWLPTLLLAGLGLFFGLGGQEYFGWQAISGRYAALKGSPRRTSVLAASAFLLLYVLSVSFSLPVALPLTLTGGALFGWPATALVLVGATAGAAVVFIAARTIFADLARQRAGPFIARLEDGFTRNAFSYLLPSG